MQDRVTGVAADRACRCLRSLRTGLVVATMAAQKLSIQDFHKLVGTGEAEDRLPRGPEDLPAEASVKTRKWIADWDGSGLGEQVAPVQESLAASSNMDLGAFKAALGSCLNESGPLLKVGDVAAWWPRATGR